MVAEEGPPHERWFEVAAVVAGEELARGSGRSKKDAEQAAAEAALASWTPVFTHGDLHVEHVFVDGDEVTGFLDWSEAAPGDALYDLATLTLANEEHLDDVLAGYGADVHRGRVRAWWSWRCLVAVRWLSENGYGPPEDYPEVAVLRSLA
jgi:aminoglycoside phosphotransferase (APT) family kinase protein